MNLELCFVSPPLRAYDNFHMPLNFLIMAAYIEEQLPEVNVSILDHHEWETHSPTEESLHKTCNKLIEQLKRRRPDVVGFGCMTPDFIDVQYLSRRVKEELPNTLILVGGIHSTVSPLCFEAMYPHVDYVVMGEGEIPTVELLKNIMNGSNPQSVEGVAFFNENGKLHINPRAPVINNLDDLPMPAYEKVDMAHYTSPNLMSIRPLLFAAARIYTARGCPFPCTFCEAGAFSKKFRFRSAKHVVDEIEYLTKNYAIDAFFFSNDTFSLNENHVVEVCEELLRRNISLHWGCQTRVDLLNDEMIGLMKRAGCIQMEFGVESGSQRVLDILKKKQTVEQVREAFKICKKYEIRTFANMMVNVPGETEEDIQASIDLLKDIQPTVRLLNTLIPYPGAGIVQELGLKIPIEDYRLLNISSSFTDLINFLNDNYRFSAHDIHLLDLYYKVWAKTRRWNPLLLFADWKHIRLAFTGPRKRQYLEAYIRELKKILDSRLLVVKEKLSSSMSRMVTKGGRLVPEGRP